MWVVKTFTIKLESENCPDLRASRFLERGWRVQAVRCVFSLTPHCLLDRRGCYLSCASENSMTSEALLTKSPAFARQRLAVRQKLCALGAPVFCMLAKHPLSWQPENCSGFSSSRFFFILIQPQQECGTPLLRWTRSPLPWDWCYVART